MSVAVEVGDWFGVPLRAGGWAVGLLVKHDGPRCAAYFFGPKRDVLPNVDDLASLRLGEAILAVPDFGDLGFINGEWPRIGRSADVASGKWPPLPGNGTLSGYGVVELKLMRALSAG